MAQVSRSRGARWGFAAVAGVVSAFGIAICGELLVRFAAPQAYMVPRWKYSDDYGHVLYPGRTMLHAMPGRFEYRYRINELGYRGERVGISNHYDRRNIVILGDSYAFGTGVQDGEEFPAVMGRQLGARYQAINLAVGGWGLPQEIRRYYEFGTLYDPAVVILQFCSNDLSDGVQFPVARVKDQVFEFQPVGMGISPVRAYLADSFLQNSQLYNFFRQFLYRLLDDGPRVEGDTVAAAMESGNELTPAEAAYLQLLSAFAADLHRRGIPLLLISVNGQLESFPRLADGVARLEDDGSLRYVDVRPWFDGVTDYGSPEGHLWGAKAHRILGLRLAELVAGR